MKITKYEHACLLVEALDQKLIIDPGMFAESLPQDLKEVHAVVVTHIHSDHLDKERLQAIVVANPEVTVFAPQDVLDEIQEIEAKKELAETGVSHTAGSFALEFFGHDHAVIYEKVPCENVGVMVNKTLYYPGDSFTKPNGDKIPLLALPAGAPWMKVGEAMDFMKAVMPGSVFPTHNAVYSEAGAMFTDTWLSQQAMALGAEYKVLKPGDSIDIPVTTP